MKCACLSFAVALLVSVSVLSAGEPVEIGQKRQLFLDDHLVAKMSGLRPVMHRPRKRGAVIRSPRPDQTIQTRSAPQWDPVAKVYKLWVLGIDQQLWESRDGLHWTPGPPSNMRITLAAIDPREKDPSRRFKAPLLNTGFAVSPDGANWTRVKVDKVPSSDEGNFSYDIEHGLFIHTIKRGGPNGRSVALATSPDFKTWTDYGLIFHSDDLDQKLGGENIRARLADSSLQPLFHNDPKVYRVDVYNMGTFFYEGVYIGLPAMFHSTGMVPNYPNTDGFHLVQLVMSRDLKNWKRLGGRQPFIGPSRQDSGAYDLTQILPPSAPVIRDDELWFYYTGLKYRASFNYVGKYPNGKYVRKPGLEDDAGAVCLAVLRRDGFISLDAGQKKGRLVTRPIVVPDGKMYVNTSARGGELQVEVLNAQNEVVAISQAVDKDSAREELRWKQGDVTSFKGQAVTIRFTLRSAQLYSYWFK